jgi:phosphate transport system protein
MKEKMDEMLHNIHKDIVLLANDVEDSIYRAIKSLETQDKKLAKQVKKSDKKVNIQEVEIEKQILAFMALHQPVAIDLRFLIAALKMNNDLERIGDHAKSISKIAIKFCCEPINYSLEKISLLGKLSRAMLHDSVQAFINQNTELAREVMERDKDIDSLCDEYHDYIFKELKDENKQFNQAHELLNVAKHLERISDYATNLAEDVIFMNEAKIIRYGQDQE